MFPIQDNFMAKIFEASDESLFGSLGMQGIKVVRTEIAVRQGLPDEMKRDHDHSCQNNRIFGP